MLGLTLAGVALRPCARLVRPCESWHNLGPFEERLWVPCNAGLVMRGRSRYGGRCLDDLMMIFWQISDFNNPSFLITILTHWLVGGEKARSTCNDICWWSGHVYLGLLQDLTVQRYNIRKARLQAQQVFVFLLAVNTNPSKWDEAMFVCCIGIEQPSRHGIFQILKESFGELPLLK